MVRVSQCILDKTLAVKSVRRYTSGDSGVEHEKLSQARGQMVRRTLRYVHGIAMMKPRPNVTVFTSGNRNPIMSCEEQGTVPSVCTRRSVPGPGP